MDIYPLKSKDKKIGQFDIILWVGKLDQVFDLQDIIQLKGSFRNSFMNCFSIPSLIGSVLLLK